jgi:hypothetical protein
MSAITSNVPCTDFNLMRRCVGSLVILVVFGTSAQVRADPKSAVVQGTVVDEESRPVPNALVRIRSAGGQTIGAPSLDGAFRIVIEGEPESVMTEITAPNYETRRRILVLVSGVANAGVVVMKHLRQLNTYSLTITKASHGRYYFDWFVENESDHVVDVVSTRMHAVRKKSTNCLDATPALRFTIGDTVQAGEVDVTVTDVAIDSSDTVAATGTALSLPCGQQHIDITVPYSFQIKGHERNKVRFVIPAKLRVSERGAPFPVIWNDFEAVTISLRTGDGHDNVIQWPH